MGGNRNGKGRRQERGNRVRDEREFLANAFRFEQEKNKILLDEVIALEDALVNRQMGEFDAVISDDTRDFWREQLLSNREKAETALRELVDAKGGAADGSRRRPLHNRATARPQSRGTDGSPSAGAGAAAGVAVKIRTLPEDAGTYRGLAIAEEAGVDGQLVLARPAMLGLITVT